jgi:hypothetical protein
MQTYWSMLRVLLGKNITRHEDGITMGAFSLVDSGGNFIKSNYGIEVNLPKEVITDCPSPIMLGTFRCHCLYCGAQRLLALTISSTTKVQCPDCGWNLELSHAHWWGRFGQWLLRPIPKICLGVVRDVVAKW